MEKYHAHDSKIHQKISIIHVKWKRKQNKETESSIRAHTEGVRIHHKISSEALHNKCSL